ncbi:unnamed protein product [Spodoptera exigua]|nr:unnamed protein product [Spodoptera exigua]
MVNVSPSKTLAQNLHYWFTAIIITDFILILSTNISISKQWYRVNKDRLCPELIKKFVQLYPDEETKEFLSASIDKSSWVWTQIWYLLAKAVLRHFWSVTDINGLFQKCLSTRTHVTSRDQFFLSSYKKNR